MLARWIRCGSAWPGIALAIGVAFSWIFALLGLMVWDPEAAGIVLLAVIPLVFVNPAFMSFATMPLGSCRR